jgi:FMN phosphatase YigB (HAD superfamily)
LLPVCWYPATATLCSIFPNISPQSFYKPRPEAYKAGIDALGLSPGDVLFVAGSSGDVIGAALAGLRVVWNNHIGLPAKSGSNPLREGKALDEALVDFL